MQIIFSPEIIEAAPHLRVLAIEADIANLPTPDALWEELIALGRHLHDTLPLDRVNKLPAIAATRAAYKRCGKEPNRYRPSAEALTRRMVKGLELYRSLLGIDLINLISVTTGHSIGGFDLDRIQGPTLTLGIGQEGEEFHAIGRGPLNIARLPLYRDALGGIGTPTSDCERTSLTPATTHLLMLINIYDPEASLDELTAGVRSLCTAYGLKITKIEALNSKDRN